MPVQFRVVSKSILWDIKLIYKLSYVVGDSGSGKTHLYSFLKEYDKYAVDKDPSVSVWTWENYQTAVGMPEIVSEDDNHKPKRAYKYPTEINVVVIDELQLESVWKDFNARDILAQWVREAPNTYWVFMTRKYSKSMAVHIQSIYRMDTTESNGVFYRGFTKTSLNKFPGATAVRYQLCKYLSSVYSFKKYDSSTVFSQIVTEDPGVE